MGGLGGMGTLELLQEMIPELRTGVAFAAPALEGGDARAALLAKTPP